MNMSQFKLNILKSKSLKPCQTLAFEDYKDFILLVKTELGQLGQCLREGV